jgi:exosortase F-associated protein
MEKKFFNDGLIEFFQHDYLTNSLPTSILGKVLSIDTFRFLINSIFSIILLHIYFREKNLIKFLLIIYTFIYVIGIGMMYFSIIDYQPGEYLQLFYSRRFIIQPLLLFILFPALLYQQKKFKK